MSVGLIFLLHMKNCRQHNMMQSHIDDKYQIFFPLYIRSKSDSWSILCDANLNSLANDSMYDFQKEKGIEGKKKLLQYIIFFKKKWERGLHSTYLCQPCSWLEIKYFMTWLFQSHPTTHTIHPRRKSYLYDTRYNECPHITTKFFRVANVDKKDLLTLLDKVPTEKKGRMDGKGIIILPKMGGVGVVTTNSKKPLMGWVSLGGVGTWILFLVGGSWCLH